MRAAIIALAALIIASCAPRERETTLRVTVIARDPDIQQVATDVENFTDFALKQYQRDGLIMSVDGGFVYLAYPCTDEDRQAMDFAEGLMERFTNSEPPADDHPSVP